MSDHGEHFEQQLERYLDGALSPAEHAAFERETANDPRVQEAIELQGRIDAGLRRRFAPPRAGIRPHLNGHPAGTGSGAPARAPENDHASYRLSWRLSWRRGLAVAAAIVMMAGGLWLTWRVVRPAGAPGYGEWRSFAQLHADAAAGDLDFWVCDDEREFVETFELRFGQGLALGEVPEGVVALGLAYCYGLSPDTIGLLGRAGDRTTLVLIDTIDHDRPAPELPAGSDLRVFRVRLGRLVLYEITPLEAPSLLPALAAPGPGSQEIER